MSNVPCASGTLASFDVKYDERGGGTVPTTTITLDTVWDPRVGAETTVGESGWGGKRGIGEAGAGARYGWRVDDKGEGDEDEGRSGGAHASEAGNRGGGSGSGDGRINSHDDGQVIIEMAVLENSGGSGVDIAARLDAAARGGGAEADLHDILRARCSRRTKMRPAATWQMRAAATLQSTAGRGEMLTVTATLALPPTVFHMAPIVPPRFADTALHRDLLARQRQQGQRPEPIDLPDVDCGFLTMDQARRLVPLYEMEPRAFDLPVVGAWASGAANVAHLSVGCAGGGRGLGPTAECHTSARFTSRLGYPLKPPWQTAVEPPSRTSPKPFNHHFEQPSNLP